MAFKKDYNILREKYFPKIGQLASIHLHKRVFYFWIFGILFLISNPLWDFLFFGGGNLGGKKGVAPTCRAERAFGLGSY